MEKRYMTEDILQRWPLTKWVATESKVELPNFADTTETAKLQREIDPADQLPFLAPFQRILLSENAIPLLIEVAAIRDERSTEKINRLQDHHSGTTETETSHFTDGEGSVFVSCIASYVDAMLQSNDLGHSAATLLNAWSDAMELLVIDGISRG